MKMSEGCRVCVFCEKRFRSKEDIIREFSVSGKERIEAVLSERRSFDGDLTRTLLYDRISQSIQENFFYHKICYDLFTSKEKVNRLKRQSSTPVVEMSPKRSARSSIPALSFNLCIFCQEARSGESVRQISTLAMSSKILQMSVCDDTMRVRLGGVVSDLCAVGAVYHLPCWVTFQRQVKKAPEQQHEQPHAAMHSCTGVGVTDPFERVVSRVNDGLAKGAMFNMISIFEDYLKMCESSGHPVPHRYLSRRYSFYEDLKKSLQIPSHFTRALSAKSPLLLYPTSLQSQFISKSATDQSMDDDVSSCGSDSTFKLHVPQSSGLLQEVVHSALSIRRDLLDTPGHDCGWSGIDSEHVMKIIPNSLQLFLSVLFGGVDELLDPDETFNMSNNLCSIAQDIIYAVSKGKKLTPKHIGLGLTLHQATRSEKLVTLFHSAGHSIGIDTVRRIDTSIANEILRRYEENGYIYIPQNIVPYQFGKLVLCSFDNIDVLEETLDGKDTFHCTQAVVWQRNGNMVQRTPQPIKVSRDRVPDRAILKKFQELEICANLPQNMRPSPQVTTGTSSENWFTDQEQNQERDLNLAWVLSRIDSKKTPSWAGFHGIVSVERNTAITTVGMMPILHAPADTLATVVTLVHRFQAINKFLGQKHTVVFADQPLYSKTKELVWTNSNKYGNVVVMLGSLHIAFNFLKAMGQHMESAGLEDLWIESGVFAKGSVPALLDGKAYYRAVRGHTLTYEALMQIKWQKFISWCELRNIGSSIHLFKVSVKSVSDAFQEDSANATVREKVTTCVQTMHQPTANEVDRLNVLPVSPSAKDTPARIILNNFNPLADITNQPERRDNIPPRTVPVVADVNLCTVSDNLKDGPSVRNLLQEFEQCYQANSNFQLWNTYMEMVEILLILVKASRIGDWEMYLKALERMLPWFSVYDHTNYARWAPVYFADMVALRVNAPEVYAEFQAGNFVVKRTNANFCQVPVDQATEWVNKVCKLSNGIIGITKTDTARDKFCATWAERSVISDATNALFGLEDDSESITTRKDCSASRISRDHSDVKKLVDMLSLHSVFGETDSGDSLFSLITKDVATAEIESEILSAKLRGEAITKQIVSSRLVDKQIPFFAPLKRVNSKTFGTLYKTSIKMPNNSKTVIKTDRSLMHRLFNAQTAGRAVDMEAVLTHELSTVPLALARTDGTMNTTAKSDLATILESDRAGDLSQIDHVFESFVAIDGQHLVHRLGKPSNCATFNDYGTVFVKTVHSYFTTGAKRVDVVFDRYIGAISVKQGTRQKREGKKQPVRKYVCNGDVMLPQSWETFLSLAENKVELIKFLCCALVESFSDVPHDCELVVGGGFPTAETTYSSRRGMPPDLQGIHEEADTRIVLHALEASKEGHKRLWIIATDTDILVLLVFFFGGINLDVLEVWMTGGSAKDKRVFSVHRIASRLSTEIRASIIGFHALTGTDSTSSFSGFGKKSCWKVFQAFPYLLHGIGRNGDFSDTEEFVCRLYGASNACGGINNARFELFTRGKRDVDKLPPTRDSLKLHFLRANFQARVWLNSDQLSNMPVPSQDDGWEIVDGKACIIWTTLESVPAACVQLVTCGCKTKCRSSACKCRKAGQVCLSACGCGASGCCNTPVNEDDID